MSHTEDQAQPVKIDLQKVRADTAKVGPAPVTTVRIPSPIHEVAEVTIAAAKRQDEPGHLLYQCDWRGDLDAIGPEAQQAILDLLTAIANTPGLGGARVALFGEERR